MSVVTAREAIHVKKGDTVEVIAGQHRGKPGGPLHLGLGVGAEHDGRGHR